MRADRTGTPTEQARAAAGWRTRGSANRGRKSGAIASSQSCAMCAYLMSAGDGWRCVHPDQTPTTGWATDVGAWCTRWTDHHYTGEVAHG